ncbi:MAG: (2,3-dihydroxybenzoyl)adenylate synthase [Terriglobia bacterium]
MLEGVVPFLPEFAARYRQKGYWEDRPLAAVFEETCRQFADRIALTAPPVSVSYRDLWQRARRLALHLVQLGIKPQDRLVVQLPNVPEFVYLYWALQIIGAIPVMALPPHRYWEVRHFVGVTEAAAYAFPDRLGDYQFAELAERIGNECPHLRFLLCAGENAPPGFISLRSLLTEDSGLSEEILDSVEINPNDPAVFQLSGGTTGVPKLIPRTHNDYLYNSKMAAAVVEVTSEDTLLVALPVAHNMPLACPGIQGYFLRGARSVLSTSTQGKDVFPLIERERITHLALVPALLIKLLNDPLIGKHDLSSVRVIQSGGQKLQPEIRRRAQELIPSARVQENFGMAEGLIMFVRLNDPEEVRMETVGRPVSPDDEVKLVDGEGREVPDGEVGELACRGPYTLRGYYRAPEHNSRVFTPEGFYLTGDLMRRHPSGNYVVEGRRKDLINRGGEKISAEEIENLILTHPGVQNVACVPMHDPVLGERTCAFVIPKPGATLALADLVRFLLDAEIAKFKLPERLELVAEFPLSPFGKVSKQKLVEIISAKLSAEQPW